MDHFIEWQKDQEELDKKNIKILDLEMEITRLKNLLKKELMKPA